MPRDIDDDERQEAIAWRRAFRRAHTCQCGDDLPGHCPGPAACPYSSLASQGEDEPEHEAEE